MSGWISAGEQTIPNLTGFLNCSFPDCAVAMFFPQQSLQGDNIPPARNDYLLKALRLPVELLLHTGDASGQRDSERQSRPPPLSRTTLPPLSSPLWPAWLPDHQRQLQASAQEQDGGRRCQPDIVLAGAAKCATTTLHEWIVHHPDVLQPQYKVSRKSM